MESWRSFIVSLIVLWAFPVGAEPVVRYDPQTGVYQGCGPISDSTVWLIDHNDVRTPKPGFIYIPNGCASVLPGVANRDRKVVNDQVVEMTQADKTVRDAPGITARRRERRIRLEIRTRLSNEGWTDEQIDWRLDRR